MKDLLQTRLAAWNPVSPEDARDDAESPEAIKLLRDVLFEHASGTFRRDAHPKRWPVRAWVTAAAALAIVVTLVVQWPTGHRAQAPDNVSQARLVDFSTRGGHIVARITDPYAAAEQLTAIFQAHGLDIHVQTVPASPSLVGTLVYTNAPGIRTLWKHRCSLTGCPVGLVIPATFTGTATVTVGRPAKQGESYVSTADVFGPGEALHCSGLLGGPASAALPVLQKLGLTASWYRLVGANWPLSPSNGVGQREEPIPSGYIIEGDPVSPTMIALDTLPTLPHNREFRAIVSEWNRGCH